MNPSTSNPANPQQAGPAASSGHPSGIYRILDANLNRCVEGLRVVEEYLRFVLEDRHLATLCKQLRHDVVQATGHWPQERLHAARDSAHDCGATIQTVSESQRQDAQSVAAASWKRAEQALRSLEEYSKVIDVDAAARLEALRFRTYTLELATSMSERGGRVLQRVRLYVLLDGRTSETDFSDLAQTLLAAGVDAIQLRDKQLDDRQLLQRAHLLRQLTRKFDCLFVMNDRPDLAMLSAADAVHVGQEELSVKDVRSIVGPDLLIGVSTHSIAQAQQAVLDGANYIGCGPTFPSQTKRFAEFAGLELLRQVSRQIRLPAFAIGGIDAENVTQVLDSGIRRIAVRHAVTGVADPTAAVRHLRAVLNTEGS